MRGGGACQAASGPGCIFPTSDSEPAAKELARPERYQVPAVTGLDSGSARTRATLTKQRGRVRARPEEFVYTRDASVGSVPLRSSGGSLNVLGFGLGVIGSIPERILLLPGWTVVVLVFAFPALEASAFVGFIFPRGR